MSGKTLDRPIALLDKVRFVELIEQEQRNSLLSIFGRARTSVCEREYKTILQVA